MTEFKRLEVDDLLANVHTLSGCVECGAVLWFTGKHHCYVPLAAAEEAATAILLGLEDAGVKVAAEVCPHGIDRSRVYCPPCGPEDGEQPDWYDDEDLHNPNRDR